MSASSSKQSTIFLQNNLLAKRNKLLNQERSLTRLNGIIDSYLNTLFQQQQNTKTYAAEASKLFPKDNDYYVLAQEMGKMFAVHCEYYSQAISSLKTSQSHYEQFGHKMRQTQLSMQQYDQYYNTYSHYQRKIDKIKSNLKKTSGDYVSRNESKYAQALSNYEKQEQFCSEQIQETMVYNNSLLPLMMTILASNYYELNERMAMPSGFMTKDSFLFALQETQQNLAGFLEGGQHNESILITDLSFSKKGSTVNLN